MSVYSSGIGYAAIQHLVRRGAKVYMATRDERRAHTAIEKLTAEGLGTGEVHYFNVDMADATKAEAAAQEFMKLETRLDVLGKAYCPVMSLRSLIFCACK